MAQHKVGERVRPEDVLERVKKHRLFPQAEASIRLCIPDIQKSFNLGIEVWLTHANTQRSSYGENGVYSVYMTTVELN